MIGGMFWDCGRRNQTTQQEFVPSVAIAEVGNVPVTQAEISEFKDQYSQQMGGMHDPSPLGRTREEATAIQQAIGQAYQTLIAKQSGLKASDEDLTSYFNQMIESQIAQARIQLMLQGVVKPEAAEKDIVEAFKKIYGKDPTEVKTEATAKLPSILADPSKRSGLEAAVLSGMLLKSYGEKANVTEKSLKENFNNYMVKAIFISGKDAEKKANEALQAVRGGLAFEKAADKYSTDKQYNSKQPETPISSLQIQNLEPLKPIGALKPGQVSDVMHISGASVVYKLISIKSSLPADFEKNKQTTIQNYRSQLGQVQLQAALDKVRKATPVTWKDEGYRVFWEMMQDGAEKAFTAADYRRIATEAKKALESNQANQDLAVLTWNTTLHLLQKSDPSVKSQISDELAESNAAVLKIAPDMDLYLEVVDQYIAQKKGPEAGQALLEAARFNPNLDAMGQDAYQAINKKLDTLDKAGLLKPELKAEIEKAQKTWRETRLQKEAQDAAQKKAEEDAKKEAAKAAKKPTVRNAPVNIPPMKK